MSKPTPGPWTIEKAAIGTPDRMGYLDITHSIKTPYGTFIIQQRCHKSRCDEKEANVQLMITAMDLLAACESCDEAIDPFLADQGDATDPRVGLVQPVTVQDCRDLLATVVLAREAIAKAKGKS